MKVLRRLIAVCIFAVWAPQPCEISLAGPLQTKDSDRETATRLCIEGEHLLQQDGDSRDSDRTAREAKLSQAIRKFEEAVPHWVAVGDKEALAKTYRRLGGLYGWETADGEQAFGHEFALWGELKRYHEQARVIDTHASWYLAKRDTAAAIDTLEKEVEFWNGLPEPHYDAEPLGMLEEIYREAGDEAKVEDYRALCDQSMTAQRKAEGAQAQAREEPIPMPAGWVDFPGSPIRSEAEIDAGEQKYALVNRSGKAVSKYSVGCIQAQEGHVHVLEVLLSEMTADGTFAPDEHREGMFRGLKLPLTQWSDESRHCATGSQMAIVEVAFEDGSTWSLEGAPWAAAP
jgi:hypothetical protein